MRELQYVRTDKNGTKIYYDWTCPRCGGAGEAQKWEYTGKICYGCGGTGKRVKPLIVKQYTPEYEEKLNARRAKKAEKAVEEAKQYADEHEDKMAETRRMILEQNYANFGCGKNGVGYVLTGKTFSVKEQIKKNGGKWIYGAWVCPIDMSGNGIKSKEINLSGHIGSGSVTWIDDFDLYEAING